MAAQDYEVRVSVKLPPGADQAAAFAGFGKLFKLDAGQVATLFAAGKDAIKRNLDHATAQKCQKALNQLGIDCEVRPMTDSDPGHIAEHPITPEDAPPAVPPAPPASKADFEPDTIRALPLHYAECMAMLSDPGQ